MKINDIFCIKIEKMLYEGKALSRIDGFPVFIDNACPDDILNIQITKINKNFALAKIVDVVKESKYRVKPFCALHNVCGSCNWQHIDYNQQLVQKKNIVYETIKNISGLDLDIKDVIPSPKTTEYRCKVQYPISQTKVSKRILGGYYKKNSHDLINIKFCHMHPPILSEILEFIKEEAQLLGISGYDESKNLGQLRHVIFRNSSDNKELLVIFVINDNKIPLKITNLSKKLIDKYPQITGISCNFNTKKSNVILGEKTQSIFGNDFYIENLSGIQYKVSVPSFFQVNPYCAQLILENVKSFILSNYNEKISILDAYAGVSSFGIWMNDVASKVTCIEEAKSSSSDAQFNVKLNKLENIEILNGDASIHFNNLSKESKKFDVSIIDPPRKGCSDESINNLITLTKDYIVYVSCNVATLARDLKKLVDFGFTPVYVQPFDMFPHTFHIETMLILKNNNKKEA